MPVATPVATMVEAEPQPIEQSAAVLDHPPLFEPRTSNSSTLARRKLVDEDSHLVSIDELTANRTETCSICHTAVGAPEETATCPSCGLTFHADCWRENLGCSAYGCDQVGALAGPAVGQTGMSAPPSSASAPASPDQAAPDETEADGFPWEFAFLAMSVGGSLLGALAYGVPAIISAIGTALYMTLFNVPRRRRSIALIALCVCILGAAGGMYLSYLWWNGWPVGRAPVRGARP